MVKINLGCGPDGVEGWENLDWGWLPWLGKHTKLRNVLVNSGILPKIYEVQWPEIKLTDIRKRLPYGDNSADWIYCSHVVEHLEKWEAKRLLEDCFRVLKKKGRIRLIAPDLTKIIKYYAANSDDFNRIFWGFEKDIPPKGVLGKIVRASIRPHQWIYNLEAIKKILKSAGFVKIEVSEFRKSRLTDVTKLDLETHKHLSFYVEAEK